MKKKTNNMGGKKLNEKLAEAKQRNENLRSTEGLKPISENEEPLSPSENRADTEITNKNRQSSLNSNSIEVADVDSRMSSL